MHCDCGEHTRGWPLCDYSSIITDVQSKTALSRCHLSSQPPFDITTHRLLEISLDNTSKRYHTPDRGNSKAPPWESCFCNFVPLTITGVTSQKYSDIIAFAMPTASLNCAWSRRCRTRLIRPPSKLFNDAHSIPKCPAAIHSRTY